MIKAVSYWSTKDGLAGQTPIGEALAAVKQAGFAVDAVVFGDIVEAHRVGHHWLPPVVVTASGFLPVG